MHSIHFVSSDEKFENYNIIDNKPYAMHLTQFLDSKARNGYVLNLNAEWGAGKTTFLHCWYNELNNNHPVVYFDAWKSDFTKDPMLALMDAFRKQLISPAAENKDLIKTFLSKGSHFVKTALPSLVVGYIKNKGGVDSNTSLLTSASEEFDIPEDNLSDALKDTMKAMLIQKQRVEGIEEFKNILIELNKDYVRVFPEKNGPVYVLIDELDRCRPTYAIEVVECVKHFFNTENFIFVLATDTNQLQHSIKSIYGSDFDSLTYLSRFFDNSVTLPTPNRTAFIETIISEYLKENPPHPKVLRFIGAIFEFHDIRSLREVQKIINVIDIAKSQSKAYSTIMLVALSILKRCYPEHYRAFVNSNENPYTSRHGNRSPNDIRGIYTAFPLTSETKENVGAILYTAIGGRWLSYEGNSFDSYANQAIDGTRIDTVSYTLMKESLISKNLTQASVKEHLSLIEFAGFFQG
ncbi:KAP family P-loop NTPase fold protein [Vibrio harveyi]